jgi:TRAP-type C4-dicarboxylate transport system permease small subunit
MSDIENLKRADPEYRVAASASRLANSVLGAAAAAILFGMMAVTAIDVFGRYLFNAPLQGGYELTQLLMLSLVFAALPLVTRRTEHIAFTVVAGSAYLSWRLYVLGGRFILFGDTTATARIPTAPFAYAGAAALALCAVAGILLAIEALTARKDRAG